MINKPGILSDGGRLKLFEAYYSCKAIDATKVSYEEYLLQAQNDYCYKEMLGQFRTLLISHRWESDKREMILRWSMEDWQALQSQLEEG